MTMTMFTRSVGSLCMQSARLSLSTKGAWTVAHSLFGELQASRRKNVFTYYSASLVPLGMKWACTCAGDGDVAVVCLWCGVVCCLWCAAFCCAVLCCVASWRALSCRVAGLSSLCCLLCVCCVVYKKKRCYVHDGSHPKINDICNRS